MIICDFFWIYLNPDRWFLLIPLDFLCCPGSDLPRQTSEPLHHRRPAGDAAEVLQPALHCQHGTTRSGSISRSPTSNTPVAQHTRRTMRHEKDGCAFQMCGQGFKLSCAVAFLHQRGRHFPIRSCIECPRKTTVQHRDIITQQDDEVFYVNRFNPQKLKKLVLKMFLFTCNRFLL